MRGYQDGSGRFGPDDAILRQDVAYVLYNLLADNADPQEKAPQQDVDQNDYYARAVNWCVENQIMSGYRDGSGLFGVDDLLTREQLAVIVANIARDSTSSIDLSAFLNLPDHQLTSSWAVDAMSWAVGQGVINGIELSDGSRMLAPQNTTSRAEIATIFMNSITNGVLTIR